MGKDFGWPAGVETKSPLPGTAVRQLCRGQTAVPRSRMSVTGKGAGVLKPGCWTVLWSLRMQYMGICKVAQL